MFRRSRFSIRPNVGATGKTASTPQESPSASQETSDTPNDVGESSTATAVTDNKPAVTPSETPTAPGDGIDQHVEGTSSSAALQRRKRFSIKPKVAPGRPSIAARKTRTPVKSASETPVSDQDKPNTSSQTGTASAPQRLQSPRRRRPSEESKQQIIQPKPTAILSEPSVVPTAEDSTENKSLLANTGKEFENISASQGNEASFSLPDKVPLSLPDKEAIAISEKARTLMSSKSRLSLSTPAFTLSRLLNDPSDLQRLAKAQKLRDLLREEMHKEKKTKRSKKREKEFDLDPAKMTMRDLIRYLPQSNPMTSSLEESVVENETVVPPSPGGHNVPEKVQEPEFVPKMPSQCEEEAEAAADEEEEEEEEDDDDDAVMVPQVRVAEDGTLIIDEESLTVEVQRAKGPNPANERDPIFERGSTTTYSSFRKGTYCKPWSSEETDMFFLAISMVGTDFSMICQLFPLRARSEIKNKFKKEERENSWRIDKAFRERRKLDIEYFSKLLEKILEVQKNRKKLKAMAEKKPPKERKKREKGRRKAGKKLSVVEEEDEEEQKENPDLEKEGEKENEDLCNEAGTTAVKSKKKRKIKNTSTEEPKDKKNKTDKKSNEQDEAFIPGDKEAALPEDCQKSDMSEKTEGAKDGTIKPAKPRPKPLLPLGRKRVQKPPPPSTKTNDDASDKGEESVIDGVSTEQVKKDASPSRQDQDSKSANNDHSSEEEEATVQPPKPTRYGRVPKPTKPLNYSAKEAASETSPASPDASTASAARPKPKSTAKRRRSSKQQSSQESKKPKLVTLRASQSEYSDEEDEKQREEEELEEEQHAACSPSRDSSAPVFVPAILRSPHPVISEVEETMEELDILATMPDVLGISQNALCPDDSCEWAQKETGTAEPCEHQLDLLVDVIDFLSIDHAEVSEDESYNEAAQTLLTIGNLAHLSQSAQNQIAIEDQLTGTTSDGVNETSEQLEEEVATKIDAEKENRATPVMSATSVNEVTETSEPVTTVELQNIIDNNDIPILESSDQRTGSDVDPTSQLTSKTDSPPTRGARLSKVKPKPNLGQASRTAQSKSQPATSTVRAAEESPSDAPDLSQAPCPSPALDMKPSVDLASTPTLTEELSGASGATTSQRRASENKDISEAQFEIRREPDTRDTRPTDEDMMSHVGTSEMSCNNPLTSDTVVAELQIGQGSNLDSVKESNDHPASCVKPLEELPVSEKEKGEVRSTTQTRKSRFQKVKPNPNLTQTSRSIHSKAQTSKDTLEKDSDSTPVSKFHEKTIAEPTFTTSTEKQSQSDVPHVPELTDEVLMSDVKSESRCNNPLKSKAAATDLQLGQVSIKGSVQESKDHPATCVTPVDKLPVGEKEGSEVKSTSQARKSRFQKIKPNLNLAQTSRTERSKAQTSKDNVEKDSDSTPTTKFHEKTIAEVDAEPTCTASPGKPSHSHVPSSDLKPSLDLASTLNPTEELSGISGATTSQQSASENLNLSEAQFESRRELDTRDVRPTSQSTNEVLMSHVLTTESSFNNPLTSDAVVAELQIGQGSNLDSVKESNDHPASCVTILEDLPVSEKEKGEVRSTTQTRKSRFQKVKPNPNLTQTSRSIHSKAQTSKDTLEKDSDSTPVSKFHEKTIAEPTFTTSTEKQSQSDVPHVPELTDEVLMSDVKSESRCNNPLKSKAAATDLQLGQVSIKGSVQESKDHPATCVTPVDKLPVGEKEGSEVKSTSQARKSRFQKIKPNLNLAQTSRTERSKAQTSKDNVEKDSDSTPTTKFHEKTIAEVDAEPTCTASPSEKPSHSPGPSSDCRPSLDFGITLKPTEELSTTEEKETDLEVVSGSTTTQPSASETQNLSEAQFETSRGQETRDTKPASESTEESASSVTPVIELPVSQKEAREIKSSCKAIRICLHQVKPKSNLSQMSRTAHSKPQVTKDPFLPMPQAETCSSPTSRPNLPDKTTAEVEAQPSCSTIPSEQPSHSTASVSVQSLELDSTPKTMEQNKNVACELKSSSEGSEQSVSQRRQRFPKVKPNLGSTTRSKLQSNDICKPAEQCHMKTSLTTEQQPSDNNDAGPGSQSECKQDMFFKATKTFTQPTDGPTTDSDVQSSGDGSTESQIVSMQSTNTYSTPDPKESTQEPPTENDPEAPSQDAVQQSSETNETSVKSPDDKRPEPADSPSGKAPPTRRGRLIKPTPTLGRSRRPPQHVKNTPDADTSLGSSTKVIEQLSQHEPLVEVSGLSTGSTTGTQDASTSSAGGTQGHPSFTTFPDMMLPQDPSDPDEPFFILSLTEIPVSSSGERVDSVPEPLPSLPVTDAPIEQQSVPGESLATAEEQPSPNVTVPVPMEDSNETGVIHVKDPDDGSTEGNQVDPHERTTVHPSTVQETGQNKDETEIPPTKERQTGTRRRETAKPQVKPKMTKRKQTSKTAAAKKAEFLPIQTDTTEQLELPGPSVQPEASDDTESQRGRADHVEVEKETLTDVVDPEGTSSGAKTTRTSSRNRKAKDSDPGKAASKSPKVKTPRAKGNRSTPAAVASTPREVTPKPGPKPGQHASEHSRPRSEQTPSTSLCPAEGSTSQPSEYMESSSLEEEPTSVSQYFLSDIFTDAESLPIQTDTTEQLELPGPSVQPEASDDTEPQRGRADHVEVDKETLTDVVDPEGTSSGAKTTRTSSRNRKAKDSDPGKAASKSPKVKTPRAKGNRSTPAAVASTPREVTPKPGPKPGQHASEHSRPRSEQTPSTSLCPAEGSTSQPSEYMESSSLEEEPTSVSQYFLSDIFTDAEEG
ncbi:transcription factor TFIIIB component B'' homolog isoform X2 [Pseudochaenichthys georgianus]|uniref:transcription factor TFIIIB component B'' homolog isoform X2 n=1 Tax=Pseudochaenichthys georgianus TaxID=52239 RepID=UPI00146B4A2A|nr:transcription factor TFIIIB component B'' homolog isoform X2 [Pseudochaenichthys georgianus]